MNNPQNTFVFCDFL